MNDDSTSTSDGVSLWNDENRRTLASFASLSALRDQEQRRGPSERRVPLFYLNETRNNSFHRPRTVGRENGRRHDALISIIDEALSLVSEGGDGGSTPRNNNMVQGRAFLPNHKKPRKE
jgi:hypothetical protein